VFYTVPLDHLRILAVTGSDRAAFLQGQLTQDVSTANRESTVLAGWADAKGRLLFAGHLFATRLGTDDALALLVPAELAEALLRRLRLYILRAKAQAAVLDTPPTGLMGSPGPGAPGPGVRLYGHANRHLLLDTGTPDDVATRAASPNEWHLADIRSGLPTVTAATTGEFVPQMVNLDLLGGISFTKGCYTGQEIVARMKYLGRVKRRMLRFGSDGTPPPPGGPLYGARGTVGQVVASARAGSGNEFLAVVVLDDLPGPFHLDEARTRPVQRLDLPYDVDA